MTVKADLDQALEWLRWWRPGGPWVLTAIAVDKRDIETRTFSADNGDELRAWLAHQGGRKWNVYFHVNRTRGPMRKKAEARDIASLDWLHVDLDPVPGYDIDDERKRILAEVQSPNNGMPPPTAVVFSGGGYQAYWRLEDPLPLASEAEADEAKRYNLQVELLLKADSCHNVDRIMRLPGTVNWPNERKVRKGQVPAVSTVLEQHDDRIYPLRQFTKAPKVQDTISESAGGTGATNVQVSGNVRRGVDLDALPDEVPARTKVVVVQGHDPDQPLSGDDQSRSAWLFMAVCSLVRAGVDDETVYSIITDPDYRISDSVLDKGNSGQVHRYAVRQIKKAKEVVIAPELAEMNEQYALVESVGGKCRVAKEGWNHALDRHEVEFTLVDGFKTTHNNRFVLVSVGKDANGNDKHKPVPLGEWWLRHPERRTYSGVIFYPGREFNGALNLWRGFACDAIPGECSLYLGHLRDVLCKGNAAYYSYLLGWMAHAVQAPHEPGHVAVVLRGKQGTGKGTWAKHFGALWGVHYKHVTKADHVTGQFNNMLKDAGFVFADECFRTDRAHVSALKTLITEETLRVEAKGVDNLDVRNCVKLGMATNEQWAVHAELDDRRFFILEVGDDRRKDVEYFAEMEQQMRGGGYEALLHHLMTYDLSEFDVRNAPQTDELRLQQQQSMSAVEAFWFSCLEEGRLMPGHAGWTGQVITDEFADRFSNDYAGGRLTPLGAKTRLGIFLRRLLGASFEHSRLRHQTVEWEDSRGRRRRQPDPAAWSFPTLEACRRAWDDEFGARDWPEVPDPREDDDVDGPGPF